MEIKEMDIERLVRERICLKRQLKDIQGAIKQIDDELDQRYNREEI